MQARLFIGFTPYHGLVASKLIDSFEGSVFCAFTKRWPVCKKGYTRVGGNLANKAPSILANILMTLHLMLLLRWWILLRRPVEAYIPHPLHVFTNPVFWHRTSNFKVHLYEDGLLNYYDAKQTGKSDVDWKTKLLLLCFGFKWTPITGHLCGCDDIGYDEAHLSQPLLAVHRGQLGYISALPQDQKPISTNVNTILFLDQNTDTHLSAEQREVCLKTLTDAYPYDQFDYFYKPHHDQSQRQMVVTGMHAISESLLDLPAEEVVLSLRPSHVVSFYSSALLNIRFQHPNICCISIAADAISITRDGVPSILSDFFSANEIVCLRRENKPVKSH